MQLEEIIRFLNNNYGDTLVEIEKNNNVFVPKVLSENEPEDIFKNGGCTFFAILLYNILNGQAKICKVDDPYNLFHIIIKYDNKYYDVDGIYNLDENTNIYEYDINDEESLQGLYWDHNTSIYGSTPRTYNCLCDVCYALEKKAREKFKIEGTNILEYSTDKHFSKREGRTI